MDALLHTPKHGEHVTIRQLQHARKSEFQRGQLIAGRALAEHAGKRSAPKRQLGEVDPLIAVDAHKVGPEAGLVETAVEAQDAAVGEREDLGRLAAQAVLAEGSERSAI